MGRVNGTAQGGTTEALADIEAHVKRLLHRQFHLERALLAFRQSKEHRRCRPMQFIDARCPLCQFADAALETGP